MREFYVGSSDENIKVADGNATMVFWKDCITRHVDCLAVQYFLTQPVNISVDEHKTNKWIFNFPTHISIDRIRDCVQYLFALWYVSPKVYVGKKRCILTY